MENISNKEAGFVFIIESPSPNDLLDGRTEGKTLIEALKLAGINGWYALATSKETFYRALGDRLILAINAFQKRPVFHFSMHGDTDGLELSNGEFISWDELREALVPFNNAVGGSSLICMSSCEGASGIRMAMTEDQDKPFGVLIGNVNETQWSDAAVAYVTFYHLFFKDTSLPEAVEAMKIASGDEGFMYWIGNEIKENWADFLQKKNSK